MKKKYIIINGKKYEKADSFINDLFSFAIVSAICAFFLAGTVVKIVLCLLGLE